MKNKILELVPEPVKKLLQKEIAGKSQPLIDLVFGEAAAYEFEPDQVVPCIMAAYYVYESTAYPDEMEEDSKLSLVFYSSIRSALKLLSYGKYKAAPSEGGWMRYTNP
ncbi:MAG: hypothetical protein ACE3JP_05380 [Ectobacillus sp.]